MTIGERIDWLMGIEKCSDNIANEDVRSMVAYHAKKIKELYRKELDEKIRLIDDMKYIVGIVERGTGKSVENDIPITKQLLDYIKIIEGKAQTYDDSRRAMKGT